LRPFLRLALSTFLPPVVDILALKPMAFFLLLLFGLYVGNILLSYNIPHRACHITAPAGAGIF
jgi:hypothetical protein